MQAQFSAYPTREAMASDHCLPCRIFTRLVIILLPQYCCHAAVKVPCWRLSVFVVPSARCDQEIPVLVNIIDKTVCLINSPAPAFSVFQRLRFSNPGGKTIALDIFYQIVDTPQRFSVLLLPVKIIVPCSIRPEFIHQVVPKSVHAEYHGRIEADRRICPGN